MRIGLDYDETYTRDPELWNNFIDLCHLRGHEIMIVTFRGDDTPINHDLPIPVYYTAAHPKRDWMNSLGIVIDIWIDDFPDLITQKSEWTDEQRQAWKQANGF